MQSDKDEAIRELASNVGCAVILVSLAVSLAIVEWAIPWFHGLAR